ncbi:hypothetical protein EAMG_04930 [Escherichia coli M056]|uniref:hypothetical protein n=1 Tax=Escherichia coli TaxID=562 RepID=UPI000A18608B|nr:hypothetical protein [Escherichia coli]OSK22042.1 hypothetical protein EAMG_04930 [Escherichia coli M056]
MDAIADVISVLLHVLGRNRPVLYEELMHHLRQAIAGIRGTLGEVDEEDIAEYAYTVAENMEQFLPSDENG